MAERLYGELQRDLTPGVAEPGAVSWLEGSEDQDRDVARVVE